MAVFIAQKPCRFGGDDYLIGDHIPADKILPERVNALKSMGIITHGIEASEIADAVTTESAVAEDDKKEAKVKK